MSTDAQQRSHPRKDGQTGSTPRLSGRTFWLGHGWLILSIAAALVLAGKHLDILQAPGCGPGGGCAEAAASVWATVPLIDWPVSFLGLAYFVALLWAWTAARRGGGLSKRTKYLVRLGAALSVMFVAAMIGGGYICWYCLAVHIGNLGFVATMELAPTGAAASRRSLAWIGGAFAAVTVVELGALALVGRAIQQQQAESTQRIIDAPDEERLPAFTGRYRLGPEAAPIRIVVISDYQCPDCRKIEFELKGILSRRDDVSLSAKQFPFCTACNRHAPRNMHPNACWAARAAEAAGILHGNDGFWQMHRWLFDHKGSFTDSELPSQLVQFGYDPAEFKSVMEGAETLDLVQGDIEEGMALGLFQTPMIFINGVQLMGWQVPGTLSQAVAAVAASNPPTATAIADRPMSALQKYLADWRDEKTRTMPPDSHDWAVGAEAARVTITLWGDYQEPNTAEVDRILRRVVGDRPETRYAFRHFPVNTKCNPAIRRTRHVGACWAAQAAEAAGALGGAQGYWRMHEWLLANQSRFNDQTLREVAAGLGFDADALLGEMKTDETAQAIAEDVRAAQGLGVRGVPRIYINGKRVPRWKLQGHDILQLIIDEAAGN